jgi:hypothetical protein
MNAMGEPLRTSPSKDGAEYLASEPGVEVSILKKLAAKYIWWQSPEEAARFPRRVLAQVMDLGNFEDSQELIRVCGAPKLADVIRHAQAGWFSPRSWHYWHYRLHLAEVGRVPALPERRFS